jgi:hypothetical protein
MHTIELSHDELDYLNKPVNGQGGFQDLLRSLGAQRQGNQQSFTSAQAERVLRYSSKYGQGGFEDRLLTFVEKVADAAGLPLR